VVQWWKTDVSRTISILLISEQITSKSVHRKISEVVSSLMTWTKMVLEAMV
jgi:hypothetical protein